MLDVRSPLTNKGYFLIERGWMNFSIFKDEVYTEREAWAYLIENAAYQKQVRIVDGIEVALGVGELVASCRYLAKAWKWKHDKVNRYLRKLEKIGWITLTTDYGAGSDTSKTASKGKYDRRPSLIKLNHYNQLQKKAEEQAKDKNIGTLFENRTASRQLADKYKEGK